MTDRSAHCFYEHDRATVVVKASDWTGESWFRKVRGYLALADCGRLQERYEADALWVMVAVEGGEQRMQNLLRAAEKVAGERAHHFWFTTTTMVQDNNLLTDAIWHVAGKPDQKYSVL